MTLQYFSLRHEKGNVRPIHSHIHWLLFTSLFRFPLKPPSLLDLAHFPFTLVNLTVNFIQNHEMLKS